MTEVTMAVAGSSAALKKKIERLARKGDTGWLDLAEALYEARSLPASPDGGRPSLADLVHITKLSRRTIGYLIEVWERWCDRGVPRERLSKIGWTKLAVIVDRCEPGEYLDALPIAEISTAKDLPALLKGAEKKEMHTVLLRLTDRQHAVFEEVLLMHGAKRPKNHRGLVRKERALTKALEKFGL
jgi:hypothetical protein